MEDVTISEVGVLSAPLVVLVTSEMRESASGLRFMVSSISGADDLQIIDGSKKKGKVFEESIKMYTYARKCSLPLRSNFSTKRV